jgi:hypothetical protein
VSIEHDKGRGALRDWEVPAPTETNHDATGEIPMRFLSIYQTVERNTPPTVDEMARMGKLIEDSMKAGVLLATEGCLPSAKGARVRRSGHTVTVTDGPFTESKELIAGFAILEADSKQHAIELTREFLSVAGDGECEIRQIAEAGDCGPHTGDAVQQQARLAEQFTS